MSKLYVVGIGPGNYEQMTILADRTLQKCEVIVGYSVYIDLIKPYYRDKVYLSTPMTKEVDRCRMAVQEVVDGKDTAIVCSGDAGVYGMAGLVYEISGDYPEFTIEIVPGVTAALSGGAVLGAPLVHDFAVISLSDLLTSWEVIEKRLEAAAKSDLGICLYNPSSKKRADYLQRACDIIMRHASEETICGIVRNIGREGEEYKVLSLKELRTTKVDMFTTVFIGNHETKAINGKMVTPRGYHNV